jgi:hypothetical protein
MRPLLLFLRVFLLQLINQETDERQAQIMICIIIIATEQKKTRHVIRISPAHHLPNEVNEQ